MKIIKIIWFIISFTFVPCFSQLGKLRPWVVFFPCVKESILLIEEEARLKEMHNTLESLHNNEKALFFALQFMKDKFQIQSQTLNEKLNSSNYLVELQKHGVLDTNKKINPLVPLIIDAAFKIKGAQGTYFLKWNEWREEIAKLQSQDIKTMKIKMRQSVFNEIMKYLNTLDDKTQLALYTVSHKIAASSLSQKDAQGYFKIISANQDLGKIPVIIQQLAVRLITIESGSKSPTTITHKVHTTNVETNEIELLD